MLTSTAASSGSSSLRCTSTGPLTAARIVKRFEVKVAEPSARMREWVVSSGLILGLLLFLHCGLWVACSSIKSFEGSLGLRLMPEARNRQDIDAGSPVE